jgi:hypothetical protein
MAIYVILHASLRIDMEYFWKICRREHFNILQNEFQMIASCNK